MGSWRLAHLQGVLGHGQGGEPQGLSRGKSGLTVPSWPWQFAVFVSEQRGSRNLDMLVSSDIACSFFPSRTVWVGAINTASYTATIISETSLLTTAASVLWLLLHPFQAIMNPNALHEVIFLHHILSRLLHAGVDQSSEILTLHPMPSLLLAFAGSKNKSSPSPPSAAVWLAEKPCYLQIAFLASFCQLLT